MRGRKPKVWVEGEQIIHRTIGMEKYLWDMLPKDQTMADCFRELVRAAYGHGKDMSRRQREIEIRETEAHLSDLLAKRAVEEKKETERKLFANQVAALKRYPLVAFTKMVEKMKDPNVIPTVQGSREVYGITCNMARVLAEREDILYDIAHKNTEHWVDLYEVRKDTLHGSREDVIMGEILKELVK